MKKIMVEEPEEEGGIDGISSLPDKLIHHILSFTCTKLAVQTSHLSKRWQPIWKTLPHFNMANSNFGYAAQFSKFLTRFFPNRNNHSNIISPNLHSDINVSLDVLQMIIRYAIAHNVQTLSIDTKIPKHSCFPLSIFNHATLTTLKICKVFRKSPPDIRSCWSLPALRVLHLEGCDLSEMFLELPALTTLFLGECDMPKSFLGLPGLTSLHVKYVRVNDEKRMYFSDIVNLKNLTLDECTFTVKANNVINVSSLQMTNLSILSSYEKYKFVILAPKLSAFNYRGNLAVFVFPLMPCLHKVNLELEKFLHLRKPEQDAVAVIVIGMLQELSEGRISHN